MHPCPLASGRLRKSSCMYVWHYLDNFITVGPPGSSECQANILAMVELCKRLGMPLAEEKLINACTRFGIEIDTILGVLRLPAEKLSRLKSTVTQWVGKRTCTKRELLSLIGQLQHVSVIVRPGRPFLRWMINLSKSVSKLTHHVWINHQARSTIMWWNGQLQFQNWNRHHSSRAWPGGLPHQGPGQVGEHSISGLCQDSSRTFGCHLEAAISSMSCFFLNVVIFMGRGR